MSVGSCLVNATTCWSFALLITSLIAWSVADGMLAATGDAAAVAVGAAAGASVAVAGTGVAGTGVGEAGSLVGLGGVSVGAAPVWLGGGVAVGASAVGVDKSRSRRVGTLEQPAITIDASTTTANQDVTR